jgi:hypothetical protein
MIIVVLVVVRRRQNDSSTSTDTHGSRSGHDSGSAEESDEDLTYAAISEVGSDPVRESDYGALEQLVENLPESDYGALAALGESRVDSEYEDLSRLEPERDMAGDQYEDLSKLSSLQTESPGGTYQDLSTFQDSPPSD